MCEQFTVVQACSPSLVCGVQFSSSLALNMLAAVLTDWMKLRLWRSSWAHSVGLQCQPIGTAPSAYPNISLKLLLAHNEVKTTQFIVASPSPHTHTHALCSYILSRRKHSKIAVALGCYFIHVVIGQIEIKYLKYDKQTTEIYQTQVCFLANYEVQIGVG